MKPNDAETLEVVESLIERARHERDAHIVSLALRGIAADIRARLPAAPGETRWALQAAIDGCVRTKTAFGYERGHIQRVGEELIARWPVVRLALERLERGSE